MIFYQFLWIIFSSFACFGQEFTIQDMGFNEAIRNSPDKISCQNIDYYPIHSSQMDHYFTYTMLPPHFQIRFYVDFNLIGDLSTIQIHASVDSIFYATRAMSSIFVSPHFNNLCNYIPSQTAFGTNTWILTQAHTASSVQLKFTASALVPSPNILAIRNFQFYLARCHKTCLTCNAQGEANCLLCYTGNAAVAGKCDRICDRLGSLYRFLDKNKAVCTDKCYGEFFDDEKQCTPDSYSNARVSHLSHTILNTTCVSFMIGPTTTMLYPSYWITIQNAVASSFFEFYVSGVKTSRVERGNSPYYTNSRQSVGIYLYNSGSGEEHMFTMDRVSVFGLTNPITYCLYSDVGHYFYQVRDTREVSCSANCQSCSGINSCGLCLLGYYLYKTQCFQTCPPYAFQFDSVSCRDYDEETPCTCPSNLVTYYLVKSYYSLDSPITDFDVVSESGSNRLRGVKFSYFNNQRVFGGILNWLSAKYRLVLSIPNPNFRKRVLFIVVLGDNFGSGTFEFQIDALPIVSLSTTSPGSQMSELQGSLAYLERSIQVNETVDSSLNSITLTVECKGPNIGLEQAWCALYNLFITVMECPPFCTSCVPNGDCTAWSGSMPPEYDQSAMRCKIRYFLQRNPLSCAACPADCLVCSSATMCDVCAMGAKLIYGECDCGGGCFTCDLTCLTCVGPQRNECQTCDHSLNRILLDTSCVCQPGFEEIEGSNDCERRRLPCQIECLKCEAGRCYQCEFGTVLNLQRLNCEYPSANGIQNLQEDQVPIPAFIFSESNTQNVAYRSFDYFTHSLELQFKGEGYYYNQESNDWSPISGDGLVTAQEQCDDGNNRRFDGCYQSQFDCDENVCQQCDRGRCVACRHQFTQLNYFDAQQCYYLCESCINSIFKTDCYTYLTSDSSKCNQQCGHGCLHCMQGDCLRCVPEGYRKVVNRCQPICGDGLVVEGEQCDYAIFDSLANCTTNCELLCSSECEEDSCAFGTCLQCKQGYQPALEGKFCIPICGDKQVAFGLEECDDGNDEAYDGCFECLFQCDPKCQQCFNGRCLACEAGWQYFSNRCSPICGDGLVAYDIEECDDGNKVQFDGCFECKFDCPKHCIDCNTGMCFECEIGFKQVGVLCQTNCGDGLFIEGFEQCDDNNNWNFDGCDENCKVEPGWVCQIQASGIVECFISESPRVTIKQVGSQGSTIEVQITFDQLLLSRDQPGVTASIPELNSSAYNITVLANSTEELYREVRVMALEIRLLIEISESVKNPVLQISFLRGYYVNYLGSELAPLHSVFKLKFEKLPQEQLNQIKSATEFTTYVTYLLISVAVLSVIMGQMDIMWNLLDLFQYLNYLKFINIEFPLLVQNFLSVFDMISIDQFTDQRLNIVYANLNFGEYPYLEAPGKFGQYQTNATFLINVSSAIICYATQFLQYFLIMVLTRLLSCLIKLKSQFMIFKLIQSINYILKDYLREFYYSSLIRLYMASFYDVTFSCLIQISTARYLRNNFQILNLICSTVVISLKISLIGRFIQIVRIFGLKSSIKRRSQYSTLFADQKGKCLSAWGKQFQSVLLLKKLIFAAAIVLLQQNGTLQSLIVSFNSLAFLTYMLLTTPLKSETALMQMIVTELFISLNGILFIGFAFEKGSIDEAMKYMLSWICVSFFSFILLFQLLTDIRNQLLFILKKLRHQFCPNEEEKAKKFLESYQNPSVYFA